MFCLRLANEFVLGIVSVEHVSETQDRKVD